MKVRTSLVLRIDQAVLDEPGTNVVLHELAARNWLLASELETREHPIRRPSEPEFVWSKLTMFVIPRAHTDS